VARPLARQGHEAGVVGEERDLRREVLLVVVAPRRVGDLDVEGVPQLPDELLVGVGRGADHGVRWASKR
jgi:hypothetical protein